MPSIAESVAARIAAVLTNTTAAGGTVYRDREDALTREESPAILVELIDEDTRALGGSGLGGGYGRDGVDEDTDRVAVTYCVRDANWQQQADALRVQGHALLSGDAQLHTMVRNFRRDRCEWRPSSADVPFGYAAQIYAFKSLTRAHALDQAA